MWRGGGVNSLGRDNGMKDSRGRLLPMTVWLIVALMVCGAFVLNAGAPVAASLTLGLAFLLAFVLALLQMILNANGANRLFFFVLAGAWVATAVMFAADWLYLDVRQMRGWLLACMALAGAAIAATWWDEMRWRRAAGLSSATVALWILCGPGDVVNRILDGGETWDVNPAEFRDPFFLAHEPGDHLVVANMAWKRVPDAQNKLTSYRDGVVVRRVALHEDMSAIGFSLPWDGHFALLQTINTYPPTARGPIETWVDVYDAALEKKTTVTTPTMHHAWIAPQPHFRFGGDDSPWRMIPLVNGGSNVPAALPGKPTRREIMLWNHETGETRIFEDYWGGYIGGWVDEETLACLRVEVEEEEGTGRVLSSTIQPELLNIHTSEISTLPPMTFDEYFMMRWQYRDELTLALVGGELTLIDWRDRVVQKLGQSFDGKALHVLEGEESVRLAWATDPDSSGRQTLNVMDEDGRTTTLEGVDETVSDVWLSPDGRRVLFSQTREVRTLFGDHLPLKRGLLRVWDVAGGGVETIHHRGLNDSAVFARPASMRVQPGCSPWSSDGRRVAITHSRMRGFQRSTHVHVLRVIKVGE